MNITIKSLILGLASSVFSLIAGNSLFYLVMGIMGFEGTFLLNFFLILFFCGAILYLASYFIKKKANLSEKAYYITAGLISGSFIAFFFWISASMVFEFSLSEIFALVPIPVMILIAKLGLERKNSL